MTTTDVATVTLHFPTGMVGFPQSQDYELAEIEGGVYEMLSTDDEQIGFVVIEPDSYFPDYNPAIDRATADRLGVGSVEDALLLLVVNIGANGEPPVANLMAPIVINKAERTATQVVLADQEWPLRATIPLG